jgi:hypothetical protein
MQRTISPRLDPVQSFFEGFENIDHLDAAQGVALVKGHLALEDLGDRDRLVDGTSHGLEDNLVRVFRLTSQVSHLVAALGSTRCDTNNRRKSTVSSLLKTRTYESL